LSTKGALEAAAIEVCDAIRRHAKICQEEAKNVSAVVRAGEDLTRAVLNYEVTLRAISGWSNPIRHLGPLPLFGDRLHRDGGGDETGLSREWGATLTRIDVAARYRLRIHDDDALIAFASGRFGTEIADVEEAIRVLFDAESWDPERYPPGLVDVEDVGVEVLANRIE